MRRLVTLLIAISLGSMAWAGGVPMKPVQSVSHEVMGPQATPCECPPAEDPCDTPDQQECDDALACGARCIMSQAMLPIMGATFAAPTSMQIERTTRNVTTHVAGARPPLPPPRA